MKLPLNSVKQYTKIPKDIAQTIEILSSKIGEVESCKDLSKKYKDIVIAQITEKKDHPNADKLAIYKINTGKEEDIQVVAGDKNLEIGDKVSYIKPGGIVPSTYENNPFKIKSVKMRGEISNGMMCSEKELDLGPNHEEVLKLPKDAPIEESFSTYYELNDTVADIENKALTNRGDLFGILGLSRELAGAQGIKFTSPNWYQETQIELEPETTCLKFDLDNKAQTLCPRYCAIAMTDIQMKESPVWLKSILTKSEIKPINIIVDITNYLMILTGQPLHAFDYNKIIKTDTKQADMGHIVVRTAKPDESIHALDGNVYELNDRHLIIANSQNPIAIAGIIGGIDTEIDNDTTNIILECANFDRYNLRHTSMDLGIVTDASTRFTRAQSPQVCDTIIAKAVELIKELADGKIASTLIDSYPNRTKPKTITINSNKLRERIGADINNTEIVKILENIEYRNIKIKDEYITVEVPVFRKDIEIEEDIYEDIIRIYGYDNINYVLPQKEISSTSIPAIIQLKSEIRNILSNSGCNELISYSFTNPEFLKLVKQDIDSCYKIKNPLSKELELMRPSIIQSLLEKAQLNTQQGLEAFAIFEIGISHQKDILNEEKLPLEEWKLSLLFTSLNSKVQGNSYYQAKRYLEKIFNRLHIQNIEYNLLSDADPKNLSKWIKTTSGSFTLNSSAMISTKVGNTEIELGIIGEIGHDVKKDLSLYEFTSGFEINLEKLLLVKPKAIRHLSESRYPYITQDICFIVPDSVTYKELYDSVEKNMQRKNLRLEMKCIDIYKKDNQNNRNITLRISLSDTKKTLKDKDFEKIKKRIEKAVKKLNISILQ